MLLQFSFENFRSFRRRTTLNMLATQQRALNDVLIRKGRHRILPSAVLYGANASGKSNVLLAMLTFRAIVASGSVSSSASQAMSSLELFPFVHDNNADPIFFEAEFITGLDHFIYSLAVSVESLKQNGKRCILEEKLQKVFPSGATVLFHRTKNDIEVGSNEKALKILDYGDNPEYLRGLVSSVVQNMDEQTLFLTGGFRSTIRKAVADKVIEYFSNKVLTVTKITDVLFGDVEFAEEDYMPIGEPIVFEEMFDRIIKAADFGPQQIGWRKKKNDKQGVSRLEMVSKYRDSIIPSDLMESVGTIRFLHFSIVLQLFLSEGGLLMIDEMDNAIHPEIMKGIISLYGNPEANKKGAQLIFTSHNPIFMDHDLLRRDQILFAERDPVNYESALRSLGDFGSVNVRNDQSFMRNYFKGRYGSLPYIDLESVLSRGMGD
jgi:AAA15 family ATPase/GTPase